MDWGLAISSSSKAYSVTTGANLWRSKHVTNNIHYPSSCITKASQHKKKTQIEYNVLRFQRPSLGHGYNFSGGGGSTYQECNRKYAVKAVYDQPKDFELEASNPKNILDSAKKFLAAFYYFSYPYTMIGITLCAFCSSALAVEKLSDISLPFFIGVLQAVIPQLFIEIYLSGVNQLYDLEIDKINKPHLPMASGQFSFKTGVIMSAAFLALSFGFTWLTGSWPLIWNLVVIASSWTAYSIDVPFMRWKRYPLVAAMCMIATWGLALPISFFHHMQTFVLQRPIGFPRSLGFLVAFMTFYSMGIALSKDIPDVEGDKEHGINSFSVLLGQKRIFWICVSLFEMAFGVGLLGGVTSPHFWTKIITGLGNVILGSILWYQAKSFDLTDKASTGSFYMYIWKLLYAALLLMAFVR
uniref:Pterocarpan prenyltransferase n=1 Tax=Cullen corylifolium TaxID=429560 RepID=A0A3G4YQH0_CULCO|nr:pterocarpan prenyltransferase [Cullen corylifolium]